MRIFRVFVDTSVFGGMFDPEFAEDTREFFRQANAGRFSLVVSEQVNAEIASAPTRVRNFFNKYLPSMEYYRSTMEVDRMAEMYIKRNIVT